MIRRFSMLGLVASIGMMAAGTAMATPLIEMTISSGADSYSSLNLMDAGDFSGGSSSTKSVIGVTTAFELYTTVGGWSVNNANATSYSPLLTPPTDLSSYVVSCTGGCTDPLTITISEIGFTGNMGANEFLTGLSLTSGTSLAKGDSVTQNVYAASCAATGCTSGDYFNTGPGSELIGELSLAGPLGPDAGVSALGGPMAVTGPYALTLQDVFTGSGSFSVDGNVTASEPGTLALFGAGLLGCALFVSRRRSSNARA